MYHPNLLKKIISPIIYITFLIPVFLGFIAVVTLVENTVGFLFDLKGFLELPFFVITLGSLLFWIANMILSQFEKLSKPTGRDHLRQSVGFYVFAFAIGSKLAFQGYNSAALSDALLFVIFIISAWAIVINAVYLLSRYLHSDLR